MITLFTHTPHTARPPRPLGRSSLSLLPFLLLLLLPAWSVAQITCFAGMSAGVDATYCEGESATLDGGYTSYTGDAAIGNPEVVWTVSSGGTGQFTVDGATQGDGTTATATNFSHTGNGFSGPIVIFTPDAGVTSVALAVTGLTDESGCNTNEGELVTLYFDPIQNVPIDAILEETTVFDDGDETSTNEVLAETGDVLTLVIDETLPIDNGQQNEDIPLFNVTYGNSGGFLGLPPAGDYNQGVFDNTFDDLTLTSISCDPATITMMVYAYYDRDESGDLSGLEECQGPVTTIDITVNPRPAPVATIGAIDDILVVCEDDDDVEVIVTGTPFTTVTYNVSLDGGATNGGDLTLDLDATGISEIIVLDANDGTAGDDIIITLTEIEFQNGPPCPVTISKPLVIEVVPLPTLVLELQDPDDAVICVDQSDVFINISTNSGPGTYTFDFDYFLDGVFLFSGSGSATIGVGETLLSDFNGLFANGGGIGEIVPGLVEVVIDGSSITKDGEGLPSCTNSSPDASVSFFVQPALEIEYEASVEGGSSLSLTQDNSPLDITICDGESIDFDQIVPLEDISHVAGITGALQVTIDDDDNLLGLGDDVTYTHDFENNPFEFDQVFDIPNSQTEDSEISITITPYFEDNNLVGLDGDECVGDPVVLNITVRPAPSVTVEVSEETVCSGESVTVTITASEAGTASLILDQGGAPILVDVSHANGDGTFFGTYSSADLTALTMFTVTTFIGDEADCSATVNQMVMTNVEELPDADISIDPTSICNGDDATVTLSGLAGSGDGFSFTYSIDNAAPVTVETEPGETTVEIDLLDNTVAGTITIELLSVRNLTELGCEVDINESVTLSVEDVPVVACEDDDDLCSGDDYAVSFTAGSPDPSAIGSVLYYQVVVTDNTSGSPVVTTTYEAASDDPTVSGTAVNMTGFDQTIVIEATPFYFDGEDPDATDFADACQGEICTTTLTVTTMPMATFGGNDAICEDGFGVLVFTGPPNGSVLITQVDDEGNEITNFGSFDFDGGGTTVLTYDFFTADFIIRLSEVTDENGCEGDMTFDFAVDVTPRPIAQFDPDTDDTICEGTDRTITLTGTAFAAVTIDSDNDANDQIVNLDENGEGSFTVTGDEDETFNITDVSITTEDGNGTDFTCSANPDEIAALEDFELTVNPAPVGALVSNRVLCVDTESPQVQFNLTTEDDDLTGTFDIVVNDILFEDVENGEVLDFTGTAFETLSETTTFTLESIVESDNDPACADLFNGDLPSVEVIVNPIPEVTVEAYPTLICSGDELNLVASFAPAMSEDGNPLFFEVVFNADFGAFETGDVLLVPADEDLNAAIGLPTVFNNTPDTDTDDEVNFTITPFYETEPGNPAGIEACVDGFGLPVAGFVDEFAGDQFNDLSTNGGFVTFDETTLVMGLTVINGGGYDQAGVQYTFTEMGSVNFDYQLALLDNITFFGVRPFDAFLVDFEGNTLVLTAAVFESGSVSSTVMPGDVLTIGIFDNLGNGQFPISLATITNFVVAPACQPCPGEPVDVAFEIVPELFADFSSHPVRVCEGDDAEICITGTPDATVTVFLGNGIFNDVKLDANGDGCFTTVGGLTEDSDFIIMGLTTLGSDPECSLTFEERPTITILVTPTPTASVSIDPAEVCAGDEGIVATVTGTPGGVVTYQIDGGDDETVDLDGTTGIGTIPLSTVNDGLSSVDVVVTLSSITITLDEVPCSNVLDGTATLSVRPLPTGEITAGDPACNGGSVPIFFEPTSDLENNYRLRITGPDMTRNINVVATAGAPVLVFDATIPGTYSLIRIVDGRMNSDAVNCVNEADEGESFSTATVIIEEVPNLTAAITGTVGTANLDSDDAIFNTFRALACDEATIDVDFGSSTEVAQALGGMMIEVVVNANDEDQVNVGSVGTSVIPFADLNGTDFLDGVLENLADAGITSVEVVLTPFFENGADAGALEVEDCAGGTLSFFIDILPAVQFDVDKSISSLIVCEGEDISITLTGSPGAEVMFTANGFTLTGDSEDGVLTLVDGTAVVTGTAGTFGTATVTVDMVMLTTIEGNISRQCMLMDQGTTDITINEVPEAVLSVEPAGPICNGETVTIIATLVNTVVNDGDSFTFMVDGVLRCVLVEGGVATLFTTEALTETTTFELTSVKNDVTGCELNDGTVLSSATIMVEEVPTGEVILTIDGEETTVSGGVPAEFQICANESIDLEAMNTNAGAPLVGEDYVSVAYSISENIDFYGLGQSGTIALPIEDFEAQFSREYNMISGAPVTITLAVTYYNENGEEIALNDDECVGITDYITIIINPNPKTEDVMTMTCSGVALDYDLDEAITNGVAGATFTYTVESDDVDVSGLDRTVASDANVTDEFDNFSTGDYTITYTVTPFGTDGDVDCQGNDFILTVTVKPEPVITAEQTTEVCSGEETRCIILLDNETDDNGPSSGLITETDAFEVISISYSLESDEFIIGDDNAEVGDVGGYDVIAFDVFTNVSSEPQTVTYVVQATSANGCVGEEETIVVTILPEAVVADMVMKVCSGGTIDLGFDELTANGVGNILSFRRSTLPLTTVRVFDEDRDDVTLATFAGNSYSNAGITAIQDSFLNQGTATLSVFYDIAIEVTGETGDEGGPLTCEAALFRLEVQIVEEVDVVLEPINGQTAICAGEPIVLVATYDGSGNEQNFEYSYTSEDGVVLELTPSAAGGEVVVDAISGMGNATVMVMVTDDNSCWAMATRVVSVGTTPEVMAITGFEDPCIGDFSFYGITPTDGSTYEWSISNPDAGTFTNMPATGSNVSIAFNNSQGYGPFDVMVTETSAAGCSMTSSLTVNLSSETTADFTAIESAEDPLTFDFTELAGGGVEAYIWNFGDGASSNEQNPSHTYTPADPDAMATYTVMLTVLGCSGPVSTSIDVAINSNLETDVIELYQGINFISFDVAPEDNRFDAIFSSVSGVRRITTVDDGAATFYQPGAGPFNSLQTAEPGYGYVVIMDNDATLTLSGEPLDDSFIRPMGMGINYMAFIPDASMVAADFWAPFEATPDFKLARTFGNNVTPNVQSYFPGFGPFNSMQNTYNGVGYLVLNRDDSAPREQSSEDYEFVYGTVSGVDYVSGDLVEVLNEQGDVIGHLSPDQSGLFKATPLYGMVEGEDGVMMGAVEAGERISFRYQDQVIDAGVSFQGQFAGTELNLEFSNAATPDKLTLSVQPNPANERTTLVLQLTTSTNLSVEAIDATGRIVRTLLPQQTLAAGMTTIEWDDLGQLPAGMYHILVTRDGRIDTELTQRLVKR